MSQHAILNPSSLHRSLYCLGSTALNLGEPNSDSEYADQGTAAHTLGARALTEGKACAQYLGQVIDVDGRHQYLVAEKDKNAEPGKQGAIDVSYVQVYVDSVLDRVHASATLLIEQQVDSGIASVLYGPVTGTGDAIIIAPEFKLIEVHDLKYGVGERVDAPDNPQLRAYGAGAVNLARMLGFVVDDSWQARMVIHQPRLDHMSDETLTIAELDAWCEWAQSRVDQIDAGATELTPGEKTCRWCPRAGHRCPAQNAFVERTIAAEFPDVSDLTEWGLGKAMERAALLEQWLKNVKSAAFQALDAGVPVPGWKLVEGREGNYRWKDADLVEKILKDRYRMTREEMYNTTLIAPTKEWQKKFAKTHPSRFEDLAAHIERPPGKKVMVPESNVKPALASVESYFK